MNRRVLTDGWIPANAAPIRQSSFRAGSWDVFIADVGGGAYAGHEFAAAEICGYRRKGVG